MADITIDIDDIISEWGAFYINQGQNLKNLKSKLYKPSETEQYFKLYPTEDTVVRNAYVEMEEVLQSYQDTFTPKGDMTFTPAEIQLYDQKIDWEKNPTQFANTWLGFLAGEGIDRAQWPIIRYIIEEHILKRREMDYETKVAFLGSRTAPVPGTAGDAINSQHGIRKLIRDWNTAGRTVPIATGAFEADPEDFCTQIEEFVESIPIELRPNLKYLFMNKDAAILYKKGKRAKYNMNWGQTSDLLTVEDVPNISVVGLESMATSEMLWTSLPENMLRPEKRTKNQNVFKVESAKRMVSIYTDYSKALGFIIPEFIIHNDRDLV